MTRSFAVLACAISLAACSTTTGVVPIGDGIFMLSKQEHMSWSGGQVKADLYTQAAAHCKALGKESVPVSDTARDATMGSYASAEVKFRCR